MNTMTIKTSDLAPMAEAYIKQGTNLLITSGPGVGKTAILKEVCENIGYELLMIHGVTCDPVDLGGLPFVNKEGTEATYLPAGVLAKIVAATKPTVCFLDDVGQATPAVQAAMMQLLWDRRIGEHAVPACVTFIAASNRRSDKAGVTGILSTLKDRMVHVEVEADYNAWIDWALGAGISDKVITFIKKTRGEAFYAFKATADFSKTPTARGWEMVDRTLKCDFAPNLRLAAITGCIGQGHAIEFEAHLRVYDDLPSWEDILNDPDSVDIPSGESSNHVLFALCGILARAILDGDKRFENAWRWAERLCDAGHVEQAAFMMHFVHRTDKAANKKNGTAVNHCLGEAFVRISAGPLADVYTSK